MVSCFTGVSVFRSVPVGRAHGKNNHRSAHVTAALETCRFVRIRAPSFELYVETVSFRKHAVSLLVFN